LFTVIAPSVPSGPEVIIIPGLVPVVGSKLIATLSDALI
jgi:hypothetical protein